MKKLLLLTYCLLIAGSGFGQLISPYLAGQNAWLPKGYGGVVYNGELDKLWPAVKASGVEMIRIGGNGVEFNMPSGAEYLNLIDSIRNIGAEPMVQVSNGRGKYTASQAANIVNYVNIIHGRNVKYWIIGNEPNLASTAHPIIVNAASVAAYIKEWSTAMKTIDQSILIVGPECSFYDNNYYPSLIGGANDITGADANGRYYLDIVSFHTYPFNGTHTRAQVTASAQSFASNVDNLIQLMNQANTLHNRTDANALQWALTEFNIDYQNPTSNTVGGIGVHSFLNGQYWAEIFNVGMQKGALSILPWSVHESSGNRSALDLGYIDGVALVAKPRSSYYHEMLVSENFKGNYIAATDNQTLITAFGCQHNDTTVVMLLNKSTIDNFDYTLQLSPNTILDGSPLKVNLLSTINREYHDKIYNQSTVVLLFNAQGDLLKKIVYSLQHAIETLPPSYLNPGENPILVDFSADNVVACVMQDPAGVTFSSTVYGDYSALSWNFGTGATPQTSTGPGPFPVSYSTIGSKNVSLTIQRADTTVVIQKQNYIKALSCIRTPYAVTVLPGVIKAVNYDIGGEGAAFHDTDSINNGTLNTGNIVPRPDEAVDTDTSSANGNIGWTETGEWLKYTVAIQKSGVYRITGRIATQSGGQIRLSVNNVDKTGVVTIPQTSSWIDYQNIFLGTVYLDAAPSATIRIDIVRSAFNMDSFTFTEQDVSGVVINRIYNATSTADGMSDAIELLITKEHTDLRGIIIKDFETNITVDNGGKYLFKDNDLWKDLRKGTTIVLRKIASGINGYIQDTDTTDFKIDLLFENTTYLSNVSASGHQFNLTNTDMVLLKVGSSSGAANSIHALATNNGGGSPLFNAVPSPKLISTIILNTGAFQYALSPTKTIADYDGAKAGNSTDVNRNWGNGYGANNIAYINSLRGISPPLPVPTIVVNRVYNGSNDTDGRLDAVELLVVKDRLDIRNLVVKDFETNNTTDNGGKYAFADNPLWQNLRSGTTIVLRKIAGPTVYTEDTDASDFKIDILMSNATYLTNLTPSAQFNITQIDMVMLKTGGAAGLDGAIHVFATKGGNGANGLLPSTNCYKLISPDGVDAGAGAFHYPLSNLRTVADYNSTNADISKSTDLNWGNGFGVNNITYIASLRAASTPVMPSIMVNRIYNGSNDADGLTDAVELLVVKDHFDARNLIVKDFETNNSTDNGGKYRLNNIPFWQDLRAGTTIVLRRLSGPAGYVEDTDASDFTIDILFGNATYVTNLSGASVFNITQFDMVVLKTGSETGVDGAIHAFATKGGNSSQFIPPLKCYLLITPDGPDAGGGSFHYPLNPAMAISDFDGIKAGISKSTALNFGYGFGQPNMDYIQSLRNNVAPKPTNVSATTISVNQINIFWTDNTTDETAFEVARSLDGITFSTIASLPANSTTYPDQCLAYSTPYYYKVRVQVPGVYSSYSAVTSSITDSIPAIVLPTLTGICSIIVPAPVVPDGCNGEMTGTTTDSLHYETLGTYTIQWVFNDGRGNTQFSQQQIVVIDTIAPSVPLLPDVIGSCQATVTPPVAQDNCAGAITGVTNDPLTYTSQGTYIVHWTFDDGHGNTHFSQQLIVVIDTIAPVIPLLPDVTGSCQATVTVSVAQDNCTGEITGVTADPLTYTSQGTYIVHWTFDDGHGNVSLTNQNVIVKDETRPVVFTKNISVTLVQGSATISPNDLNNGSTDDCGIDSLFIDKRSFDCSNIGDNTVVLTVKDIHGNRASANATVKVIGSIPNATINVFKLDHTYTGLDNNTIALGYGAQFAILTAIVSPGGGPYTFTWSPSTRLISTSTNPRLFVPTVAGNYTYQVTTRNSFGCSSVSIPMTLKVIDVRADHNKILVCKSGKTKKVEVRDVANYLRNGATLGACSNGKSAGAEITGNEVVIESEDGGKLIAYPNPMKNAATFVFTTAVDEQQVVFDLYDSKGMKMQNIYRGPTTAQEEYSFSMDGVNLSPGIYLLVLQGQNTRKQLLVVFTP